MLDINVNLVILGIIVVAGVTVVTKIVLESLSFGQIINKKRMQLQGMYTKELENEIDDLNAKIKSQIAAQNRKERGPQLEDGDFSDLIPMLIGDLSGFLPKKLQPLFQNKDLQKVIIQKIMDDPEKFKPIIDKFIKRNNDGKGNTEDQAGISV